MRLPWKRLRLIAYSGIGTSLAVVVALVEWTPVEVDSPPVPAAVASLGTLMALLVILDVSFHTWRGEGQACPKCGHLRRMKPFRMYLSCPECGGG